MLILNTNPQSSPVHNAFLTQICITPSALSEPQLTSVFHGIDRVVHRVADPDKESSTLMAQVEEAELKQQQDFIKKARKKSIPRCTIAIMAICTIFLVLEYLLAYLDGNMESAIVAVGGYYKMSIVAAHEYWRILSGGFVHNGVVHFVISLYALYATGKLCEQRLGRGWYMAVFLSSVILGNAAQLIAAPNGIATGMSAGILVWRQPFSPVSCCRIHCDIHYCAFRCITVWQFWPYSHWCPRCPLSPVLRGFCAEFCTAYGCMADRVNPV